MSMSADEMSSSFFFKCIRACVCDSDNFLFDTRFPFFYVVKKRNNERLKYYSVCLFLYFSMLYSADTDKKIPYTWSHFISYTRVKRKANDLHDDCLSFITISFGSIFTKIQVCFDIYVEDYLLLQYDIQVCKETSRHFPYDTYVTFISFSIY